jgi:hypothetical protein
MKNIIALIERCGYQEKHKLGLWLMKRYGITYETANESFMKGLREQERDNWEAHGERVCGA